MLESAPSNQPASQQYQASEPCRVVSLLSLEIDEIRLQDPKSPLCQLYEKSRANPAHVEGDQALGALREYVRALEQSGYPRCSPEAMEDRISFMESFAEQVFEKIQNVGYRLNDFYPERGTGRADAQAVVFFGSFPRGKPVPGDVDVRVAIQYAEHRMVLDFCMGYNESQSAVRHACTKEDVLPQTYSEGGRSIKIQLEADSHYNEGGGLEFVEKGPFLAFVRNASGGNMHMFFNPSGTQYLNGRQP